MRRQTLLCRLVPYGGAVTVKWRSCCVNSFKTSLAFSASRTNHFQATATVSAM